MPDDQRARAELQDLLRHVLGSAVKIASLQIANQRRDYRVFIVHLERPELALVIKLAGPDAPYPAPFERTAALHALVAARTTVPIPQVLAADTTRAFFPWRYIIKTYLPGQQWVDIRSRLNPDALADCYQQLGQAVAQLHSLHFDGFGELDQHGELRPAQSFLPALSERARQFILDPGLRRFFLAVLQGRTGWFAPVNNASLCHEDLHGYNLLFEQASGRWQLSAVLDFDKAWAGHHEIDLARMDLWTGMSGPAFWQAYQDMQPVDPGFAQRKLVYQLQWCLEFPHRGRDHRALTRRVCMALGISPPPEMEEPIVDGSLQDCKD